jgi:hypothetical protein
MAENIKKYLKYAKDLEVSPPSENMDDKIIYEVSHIKDEENMLDENFKKWLKNNNSRYFLIKEKIKNNPGKLLIFASFGILISAFMFSVIRNIIKENDISSSSKNKA